MSDPHDHADKFRDDSPSVFPSFAEPFPLPTIAHGRTVETYVGVESLRTACTIIGWLIRAHDGHDVTDQFAAVRAGRTFLDETRRLIEVNSNSGPAAPIQGQ